MEQTLGKRIANHRKRLGLTQEALAEQLGITAQAVSKWENDLSCPDIAILPRLADIFGVSTDDLLGHAPVHSGEVVEESITKKQPSKVEIHWENGWISKLFCAIGFVAVGILTFLSRWNEWEVSFWEILWPSMLLSYGLGGLFRKFSALRLGLALLGGYWLGANLHVWHLVITNELIFPICVVLFGLGVLADALKKSRKSNVTVHCSGPDSEKAKWSLEDSNEELHCSLSFGSRQICPAMANLQGGEINLSFGSLVVDLSNCQHISPDCCLEVNCSFGEVVLRLPKHIRILHSEDASFGSVQFSGGPDADTPETITLEANVAFGKIQVEYI